MWPLPILLKHPLCGAICWNTTVRSEKGEESTVWCNMSFMIQMKWVLLRLQDAGVRSELEVLEYEEWTWRVHSVNIHCGGPFLISGTALDSTISRFVPEGNTDWEHLVAVNRHTSYLVIYFCICFIILHIHLPLSIWSFGCICHGLVPGYDNIGGCPSFSCWCLVSEVRCVNV